MVNAKYRRKRGGGHHLGMILFDGDKEGKVDKFKLFKKYFKRSLRDKKYLILNSRIIDDASYTVLDFDRTNGKWCIVICLREYVCVQLSFSDLSLNSLDKFYTFGEELKVDDLIEHYIESRQKQKLALRLPNLKLVS